MRGNSIIMMEKKKLLLISISVGVFLVIIIGASILVFSPRRTGSVIPIASSHAGPPIPAGTIREFSEEPIQPSLVDPVELIRNPGESQILQSPPAAQTNNTAIQENNIYINGDPVNTERIATERVSGNTGAQLVINIPPSINPSDRPPAAPSSRAAPPAAPPMVFTVPKESSKEPQRTAIPFIEGTPPKSPPSAAGLPRTAGPPEAPRSGTSSKPPEGGASTESSRSIAAGTAPAEEAVSSTAGSSRAAPAAGPQTTPSRSPAGGTPARSSGKSPGSKSQGAAQRRVYDTYWVQTGSFSTQNKAEGVKEVLASKGITSIVENRDVNGTLFYRVRVGPYTSSNEADYWLSLIKTINGFEDSQVWKSQARQ